MNNDTKTSSAIINSHENHSEYLPKPPEHQTITPYDLAEIATEGTLPDLYTLLHEIGKNEEYQINILDVAAKKLNRPIGDLLKEFRASQKDKKKNKQSQFQFHSVPELYSNAGPIDWVVKSYLDKESLDMLYGKSETLKSFAVIDMGLCIATGTDWHGNPVIKGSVFYICGEGHNGISRRLRAWELHHKINLKRVPFFVSNRPAQLLNEESALAIVDAVNALRDENGKPILIIIDTLNRNFGPGDENSTSDMTTFVNIIDTYLRRELGCAVFIVHHTGLNNQTRARGSYSLHAALDWEYEATRHEGMILELKNTKSKDSESPSSVFLRAEVITLDWVETDGTAIKSLILKSVVANTVRKKKQLKGTNKIAYDSLLEGIKKNGGKPINTETWRTGASAAGISKSEKSDTKLKAFNRAKDHLIDEDMIVETDDYWKPKLTPDTGHEPDIKGHCPEASRRTDTDTPPIGVSSCPDVRIDGECK